ncbi:MAG: patatin-like phospholipase family protein [Acidimicrobiaceae bacterium]|nr:patatin-like phospholipase family protein [Acidimicrobiaceae bacterium]
MSKALVLGGGGPVGIGWEAGLITGLGTAGVSLADASFVVGTSAGSVVGAHLSAGLDLEQLVRGSAASEGPSGTDPRTAKGLEGLMVAAAEALAYPGPPEEARALLGRFALEADTPTEDEFLQLFADLDGVAWPDRFACTAVDTGSGAFAVWDRTSGVALPRGVASSCSVPGVFPPVTIHGRRWMDGGMRTGLNIDLARSHDVVVGVSVFPLGVPEGVTDPLALKLAGQTDAELDLVRAGGARLAVVEPNQEFLELSGFGLNLMDFSLAAQAFEAGVRQAAEEASRVGEAWG